MSNNKDFLTYHQQMKHLRKDKHIDCKGSADKTILCRYGYFNLVNGYKNPFVSGKDAGGNHMYYAGTGIKHLNALKTFDDDLRMLLLKYIVRAEEEVRTFAAYKFDEINDKGKNAWFQVDAFDTTGDVQKVVGLISKAYSEISRSKVEYITFYLTEHKLIPTWILVKAINFSTFIDFVKCSKRPVPDALCSLYSMTDARGFADHKLLIGSLHCMRTIRNMCAHNERIYTFERRNGRIIEKYFQSFPKAYAASSDQKILDLLVYLKYYLDSSDYEDLIATIKLMLLALQSNISANAFDNVRGSMGIKDMAHLELLLATSKTIDYNKF